jgi:DNA-binding NarL/FixJ family response regulator
MITESSTIEAATFRREYEVLQLLRVGSSNAEIASQLHNSCARLSPT